MNFLWPQNLWLLLALPLLPALYLWLLRRPGKPALRLSSPSVARRALGWRVQMHTRDTELTAVLAMVAAMLIVVGAALSVLWFGRVA